MGRIRVVLSWAFVRAPAAAYEFLDAEAGSFLSSLVTLGSMALVCGVGAGIGSVVGLLSSASVGDAALVGAGIGLGSLVAWILLVLVVVAVLWVRGVAPAEAAAGQKPHGKHAGPVVGWRRRGQPMVPGSLVAFFALMAFFFVADGGHAWFYSRPRTEQSAVVDGTVVEAREPAWYSKGSGTAVIRYTVASVDYTFETGRDPGDHFLRTGDVVPVEYVVARPEDGRSTWTVEGARSDARFGLTFGGICAGLALLTGVGYGVGRWRSSDRRFG